MTENVPTVLYAIGLIGAAVEQYNARGRAIGWWAVIAVCVGLLWGALT